MGSFTQTVEDVRPNYIELFKVVVNIEFIYQT